MHMKAWERVFNGVRYWFNATPYEVKVFRLRTDGGDLVHHWRDIPDTVGEYDRYSPETYPMPGQVAWSRHWDRNCAERLYVTACPVCGDVVPVTLEQRMGRHNCAGDGTAATLKAARVRDDQLNPEEASVQTATARWWYACRGPAVDPECHHPVCHERAEAGFRWTLSGWKQTAGGQRT
ncbi:hypothetical protein [Streptomyces lycii]|uniref:Uncharacterized protein n=1 Tax=Streptomyces lycii TaxID=2654337 RepID=A0ABQ7FJS5_9ACTN|nr:hypothetical protein [Streptomyces lycii]KAF4408614.1 hypothetical protein GCU69_13015 [Streptomyces lycii]